MHQGQNCEIRINGYADWRDFFRGQRVALTKPPWIRVCQSALPTLLHYLRVEAKINGHSFDRNVVCYLISHGFEFEELEIEYSDYRNWGHCVWYRDHPTYQDPREKSMFRTRFLNNLSRAVLQTETSGDQEENLLSAQMCWDFLQFLDGADIHNAHILLDKKIIYRKVVFTRT